MQRFEVASIKPVDPNVQHRVGVKVDPGGRVVISGLCLKDLVVTAFRLSYWQISGGGGWISLDQYNIEATPPANLRSSIKDLRHTLYSIEDEHLREMLQALLVDRFQLKFHRETKTGDVYLLERNGKPLGLRPAASPPEDTDAPANHVPFGSVGYGGGKWTMADTTMQQLAAFAADYVVHAPVLDRTELSGSFDYQQRAPDSDPNYSDNSQSFLRQMAAVGLKLERSKGPVEIFTIDHAAKASPN